MRRMFLAAVLGIALFFAASLILLAAWTRVPSSSATRPDASATATPPAEVNTPLPAAVAPPPVASAKPLAAAPSAATRAGVPQQAPRRQDLPRSDRLKVSFQLDPRLTRGLHMGERWVSPPTYAAKQRAGLVTVAARVAGTDAKREPVWTPSQPDMVAVTPERGRQVEISVLRTGESALVVAEGAASRTLLVKAVEKAGSWQVDISQ